MEAPVATGIGDVLRSLLAESERHEESVRQDLARADLEEVIGLATDFVRSGAGPIPALSRAKRLAEVIDALVAGDLRERALEFAEELARGLPPPVPADDVASACAAVAAVARAARVLGADRAPGELSRWVGNRLPACSPVGYHGTPELLAARISASVHADPARTGAGAGSGPPLPAPVRIGVEALLRAQHRDGGWSDADGGDATARVLDDALAIALLAEPAGSGDAPPVAVSVARALARLAGTQGPAGDWRGDLAGTIANLRCAILLYPVVAERFPGALAAVDLPEPSGQGRFVERGLAWCLSRKPDFGWSGACRPDPDPGAALRLATAGIGLLHEYGAWRSDGPFGPVRWRGLA